MSSKTSPTKSTQSNASPKLSARQRALKYIRPTAPAETPGFRWTKHPEVKQSEVKHPEIKQPEFKHFEVKHAEAKHPEVKHPDVTYPEAAAHVEFEFEQAGGLGASMVQDGAPVQEGVSFQSFHENMSVQEDESAHEDVSLSVKAATRKHVFAHFMVGNTYPYTIDNWLTDIKLAASQDIDGFVLNVGVEDWQTQRCADCFAAANQLPSTTKFSLFFSFDMTSVPGNTAADVQRFRDYIAANFKSTRMFRHPVNNKVVVSTFSGENSTFGQGSMENGWAYLKAELNKITPIFLIPSFFVSPARYPAISAMDGAFNWNGGWPIQLSASSPRRDIVNAVLDSDLEHIRYLIHGARSFMAAVSPWFFTHYGPDTWNKNWIYRGDDWLFVRRWEQLIAMRECIDMVQIISWNDYGESHYIGPIEGAQPNSQAWVDGYPHVAWLYLNHYFMKAFQTGTYPAITKDQIFLWARPHPRDAAAPDGVPRPTNYQITDDTAWMVVFATATATVDAYTTDENKVTFLVKAGMTKLSFPLQPNGGMKAIMIRNNTVVTECNPVAYRFESRPAVYNFNACVAMSP